ncbi:mechanosensitive ion channel [Jeotgalibaca sp. MA1X17-3]|uniref:mechanosensitive ion channel n=1 Tax=Jeotgalibaca sp. MA1X17-3 TaxID=2908211 RepID=UPI001F18516C|nr:mechanosensitive ion channel [Jeotgalibaca sp. MA1X17-3]UJF16220.1 mechanosensitive ion channel [Jeotgalibaca sp. MA1X17-3]
MNEFTDSLQGLWASFLAFLPNLLGAILLLVLAWVLATLVKKAIVKGLQAIHFNQKLASWGVVNTVEDGNQMIVSLGKVFYYLVWLFFIPGILERIGLANIAAPITNMFDSFLAFIPKLFGAAIILAIGYFVAKFVKELVQNLLETVNVDRYVRKYTSKVSNTSPGQVEKQKHTIAKVLANTVFVVILIPIVTMALDTLQIKSISEPIVNVLNQILAAIPNILVAVILLIAGGLIAKIVGDLLEGLLETSGIDRYSKYLNTKGSTQISLSNVIAKIVQTVIVIFFLVEALNTLNLQILNTIGVAIISYLPSVLFGLIILGLGIVGGNALSAFLKDSTGSGMVGAVVKYLIYVMAIFMTLDQLQFASTIVNTAFLFIIGGLAVAFALAFGLGGREFAKKQLNKLDHKINEESTSMGGSAQKTEAEKKMDPNNPR